MKAKKHFSVWREIREDCGLIVLPAMLVAIDLKLEGRALVFLILSAIGFMTYRSLPWRHPRWQRVEDAEAETFRAWIVRSHAMLILLLVLAPAFAIAVQLVNDRLPHAADKTFVEELTSMRSATNPALATVNPPPVETKVSYLGVYDPSGNPKNIALNPAPIVIASLLKKPIELGQTLPTVMLLFFFVFAVALLFSEFIGGRAYRLDG
jgi:hypothetical protein